MKRLLLYSIFLFFSFPVFSVPAYPYLITVSQPDGEVITLKMKGDERIKWMESEDGYSLLYDKNNNIVYAILDEKGDMTPSSMKVSNLANRSPEVSVALKTIPKGLQYSREQIQMLHQIRIMKEKTLQQSRSLRSASQGVAKAICALIQFPDKPFTRSLEDFERLMNQPGYNSSGAYGSVKDFYIENSYGKMDLQMTVTGVYMASREWKYYGENDNNKQDKHPEELAKEAADFAFNDPLIDPADYDNDGDGYIDAFHVIYAGYGEEAGGGSDCIWAHEYGFYPRLEYGNKYLDTYSASPELRSNQNANITYIGVVCHELGHVFGAPDFYDTGEGKFSGTGKWDLMGGGSWNSNGARPAHINMYQKIQYGWVEPKVLNAPQNVEEMRAAALSPDACIIETSSPDEYYVLENRQRKGFDMGIPGHGLLIYHVSVSQSEIRQNTVNSSHPQKVYPVFAANTNALPTGTVNSYGSINSAACPFPGTSQKTEFSQTTIPAMRMWNGEDVPKPITNITETVNGLIAFQFMEPLLGLTASVSGKQVTLNWNEPENQENKIGYNVYCDDKFLNFTTEHTFRNTVPENGVYIYGVSIKYDDSESEQEKIEVLVNSTAMDLPVQNAGSVFPNPVESGGFLTVYSDDPDGKASLLFYQLSGQLIRTMDEAPDGQYQINMPSGMYLLKIKKKQGTAIFKLTVK
jgi:M6 family metalloprotease-like protein